MSIIVAPFQKNAWSAPLLVQLSPVI